MQRRALGKTNLQVSRLSMGAMTFGSQVAEADGIRMIDRCLEAGINSFDTANVYNAGAAEIILGKALRGRRHEVILATKVREKVGEDPDDQGLTRNAIRKAIDASLKRLGTDYVDLYYLHQPDWDARIEDTLAAMDELVTEGKVRYPATSNYASWQILQMLWQCENRDLRPPLVSQQMYNLLARGIEQEYLAFSREYDQGLVVYNPLAGGLLSGKHAAGESPLKGTRFDGNTMYLDRYWHEAFFGAVEALAEVAAAAGLSLIQLAFGWLLAQEPVDSVILGASTMEQLEENLRAASGAPLPEDVLHRCNDVWAGIRGVIPMYNR